MSGDVGCRSGFARLAESIAGRDVSNTPDLKGVVSEFFENHNLEVRFVGVRFSVLYVETEPGLAGFVRALTDDLLECLPDGSGVVRVVVRNVGL